MCYIYINHIKDNFVRLASLLCVALLATVISCKNKGDKYISEGEIHYKIEYRGKFAYPTESMPNNLIVSFKKDKILFDMTGFGNSGIVNLSNPDLGIFDTYYNFFGVKKYYYAGKADEKYPGLAAMNGIDIKESGKEQMICGYNCKHAEVTFNGNKNKVYNIWYTDEIEVESPNASTPFSEIDGVLMAFFFIMGKSELHFMCEAVYSKELTDNIFERKPHYLRVSKPDIESLMNDMLVTE